MQRPATMVKRVVYNNSVRIAVLIVAVIGATFPAQSQDSWSDGRCHDAQNVRTVDIPWPEFHRGLSLFEANYNIRACQYYLGLNKAEKMALSLAMFVAWEKMELNDIDNMDYQRWLSGVSYHAGACDLAKMVATRSR